MDRAAIRYRSIFGEPVDIARVCEADESVVITKSKRGTAKVVNHTDKTMRGIMKRRTGELIISIIFLVFLAGCVEKTRHLTPADKERIKTLISKTAPRPMHKLDIKFEDKVLLLGYDYDKPNLEPGETFKVTWYWKAEKELGNGWQVFTHVADAKNVSRINADAERVIRNLYPAEDWKAGEYIKDEQEITIPANWDSTEVRLYLGLWNGPHRMHITRGKDDGEHRVLAVKIPVRIIAELSARKTSKAVTIDGVLDEEDWKRTEASGPFSETGSGEKGLFMANSRVMYDDQKLYVAFEVNDSYVKSTFGERDEHLWEQDAVEIMLDPNGDGKNYFEIEVSPTDVVFDTRYDSPRKPKPFGHIDWDSQAEVKAKVEGKPNDDKPDKSYVVELAIPWQAFNVITPTPALPPVANSSWRVNFFVMDVQKSGKRAVGWSPPLVSDFHVPDRFGVISFLAGAATDTKSEKSATTTAADKSQETKASKDNSKKKAKTTKKDAVKNKNKAAPTK